jgi:hypothetical protein
MGWQIPGAQGPRGYQEMADNPGYAVSIGIGEAF